MQVCKKWADICIKLVSVNTRGPYDSNISQQCKLVCNLCQPLREVCMKPYQTISHSWRSVYISNKLHSACHSRNYCPRLLLLRTLSRLSSRFKLFIRGGEFPLLAILDLRLRLNFAMSSPNTSPVRRAEMRSSNSPLASPVFSCLPPPPPPTMMPPPAESPLVNPFLRLFPTLARIPSLLLFRSIVRFFSCMGKE